jgi:hypothetical protein
MRSWIKKSATLKPYINKWRREERKMIRLFEFKIRLTKQLKRCDTLRMTLSTKSIDNIKEIFSKKAPTTKICGMKPLTMAILLLMMPLL